MIGSSYEGFTVVMALLHPNPALKMAAPESPMVDGWMGDDWFHYGAFRQPNIGYILGQTSRRGTGVSVPHLDDYANYLEAGTAGDFARYHIPRSFIACGGGDLTTAGLKLADQPRFEMILVDYFACIGLVLAIIGVYGVTTFLMMQRTPEVGIRIALGASKENIVRLILAARCG